MKCKLLMMSGEVVATTYPELGDKRLSLGHFFHIAKTSLGVAEREISLVIGRNSAEPVRAESMGEKFFALASTQDAIAEHGEVEIYVVRVDARNED
jgi:hypothetical protein